MTRQGLPARSGAQAAGPDRDDAEAAAADSPPGIVRVCAGPSFGTGFLVLDGDGRRCILTALHNVAYIEETIAADRPVWIEPNATITFHNGHSIEIALDPLRQFDIAMDWVLLRPDRDEAIPPHCKAYLLADFEDTGPSPQWMTHGYSLIDEVNGTSIGGTIRARHGSYFSLNCDEFEASIANLAPGYSGAPCIWEGVVIALITHALLTSDGKNVLRRMHARPIGAVAKKGQLRLEQGKVPFESEVVAELGKLQFDSLADMATDLGVPPATSKEVLLRRMARTALRCSNEKLYWAMARYLPHIGNPLAIAEMSYAQKLSTQGACIVEKCIQAATPLPLATLSNENNTVRLLVARALNRYGEIDQLLGFVTSTECTQEDWQRKTYEQLLLFAHAEAGETDAEQLNEFFNRSPRRYVLAYSYDAGADPLDMLAAYQNVRALTVLESQAQADQLRHSCPACNLAMTYDDEAEGRKAIGDLNYVRKQIKRQQLLAKKQGIS